MFFVVKICSCEKSHREIVPQNYGGGGGGGSSPHNPPPPSYATADTEFGMNIFIAIKCMQSF